MFERSEAGEADILFASNEKAIDFGIDSGPLWGVRLTPTARFTVVDVSDGTRGMLEVASGVFGSG